MSDQIISTIRLSVAMFVGWLVVNVSTWSGVAIPEALGTGLEEATVTFVSALVAILYYLIVRLVSKKFPWVEGFLGYPASPVLVRSKNINEAKQILKHRNM